MKRHHLLVAAFSSLIGSFALADGDAGFTIDNLPQATKLALDSFKTANPTHVEHFTGYKSWISGDDSRVKIYVSHEGMNMEFNFLCHNHEEGIECHAQ